MRAFWTAEAALIPIRSLRRRFAERLATIDLYKLFEYHRILRMNED
jgi:hypothetical protein